MRAYIHFKKAASKGHVLACYNAAVMQAQGEGTPAVCEPASKMLLKKVGTT